MVKLVAVVLSALKAPGSKQTEVVEHKDGIVIYDDAGQPLPGLWVNQTSGERSGEKRPFVVIHYEERNVEAAGGGNTSKDPYYGTFRPDGSINWNHKVHPREFQEALNINKRNAVSVNQIGTVLDEFTGDKRIKFLSMDAWDFMVTMKEFDMKVKSVGRFISCPTEEEPLLKGINIRPYEINGRMISSYTMFVYTPTIKAGREAILRAFVDANPDLIFITDDGKGGKTAIMDATIRETERAANSVDPGILAQRKLIESLSLPGADEKNLQLQHDETYAAIQDLDSTFASTDPKDITADMKKQREELGKLATDLKNRKGALTTKRLDQLAVEKTKL